MEILVNHLSVFSPKDLSLYCHHAVCPSKPSKAEVGVSRNIEVYLNIFVEWVSKGLDRLYLCKVVLDLDIVDIADDWKDKIFVISKQL